MNMVEANSANYERLEKKYRKLNKRQEEFCLNILSGKTAKESYILAYDLPKEKYSSAASSASRLKKSPMIREYLNYEKARQLNELRDTLNPAAIVEELVKEAFSEDDDNMKNKMRSLEILVLALGLNSNLIEKIIETEEHYLEILGEGRKQEESAE